MLSYWTDESTKQDDCSANIVEPEWERRARSYWKDNTVDPGIAEEGKRKKVMRTKAKTWLLATDKAMRTICDEEWGQFVVSKESVSEKGLKMFFGWSHPAPRHDGFIE